MTRKWELPAFNDSFDYPQKIDVLEFESIDLPFPHDVISFETVSLVRKDGLNVLENCIKKLSLKKDASNSIEIEGLEAGEYLLTFKQAGK